MQETPLRLPTKEVRLPTKEVRLPTKELHVARVNSEVKYDSNTYLKIAMKKEYAIYSDRHAVDTETVIDQYRKDEGLLELTTYQSFINNFFNYNTDNSKLFLIHGTGTGKTLTSLSTMYEYVKGYRDKSKHIDVNNIIIVGFTKNIFKKSLLFLPEFGFLTKAEIDHYKQIEAQSKSMYIKDLTYLSELKTRYSKRLVNRKRGGIFKFYGYRELFIKLFDMTKLNEMDSSDGKGIRINKLTTAELMAYIESGDIIVNMQLLQSFSHSLIICDEIHNAYNSFETNNWGSTLEIIMNYFTDYKHKDKDYYNSIKIMFLTATPITNSPIELVSIINLLNNYENQVNRHELFDEYGILRDDALPKIEKLLYGKISYVMDNNPIQYPICELVGDSIQTIEYLKFIRCPMSKLHRETYIALSKQQIEESNRINSTETQYDTKENTHAANKKKSKKDTKETGTYNIYKNSSSEMSESILILKEMRILPVNLALSNRYLNDYVLPNPIDPKSGLYLSKDIEKIYMASSDWKTKHRISIEKNNFNEFILSGDFLLESNISSYSSKYYKLLTLIKDIILNKTGKIFIYHQYVYNSGIMFIDSLLQTNGFLLNDDEPMGTSICSICYKTLNKHKKTTARMSKEKNSNSADPAFDERLLHFVDSHEFRPIRYTLVTGHVSRTQVNRNIERFNNIKNLHGEDIKMIIGSKAISESFDIKAIQHVIVTHSPDNISGLVQVIGRAIRKNSHIDLEPSQRKTSVYILVSTLEELIKPKNYPFSFEEARYRSKINIYNYIQKIENIFYDVSVDYLINSGINKGNSYKIVGPSFITKKDVNLYNKYKHDIFRMDKLDIDTFTMYYTDSEINIIKGIIKRLFIEFQPIFTYVDLFKYVKDPPFTVELITSLLSESSFAIALKSLIYVPNNIIKKEHEYKNMKKNIIESIKNKVDKMVIGLDGQKYIIVNNHNYFILTKYSIQTDSCASDQLLCNYENLYGPGNTNMLQKQPYGINMQNVDYIFRQQQHRQNIHFYLKNYNDNSEKIVDFNSIFNEFIEDIKKGIDLHTLILEYSFDFNKYVIELIITSILNHIYKKIVIRNDLIDMYIKIINEYTKMDLIIYSDIVTNSDISSLYLPFLNKKHINTDTSNTKINRSILTNSEEIKLPHIIPIGHFISNYPYLYNIKSEVWFAPSTIFKSNLYKNNNIYGFDYKDSKSLKTVFKLKLDSNDICINEQNTDKSKKNSIKDCSKGMVCNFYSKSTIISIYNQLNISLPSHIKKRTLCSMLRKKIIELDNQERNKNTNIRFYYKFYEL